jgi:hypothetical protein
MSVRGWFFIAATTCWLATGVTLKVARLTNDHAHTANNATTKLTEFLADFGWEPSDVTGAVSYLYTTLVFEKAGCAGSLAAVLIGPSTESEHLLKTVFHNDVVFIQNGYLSDDLHGFSHHIRYVMAPLLSVLGLSEAGAWPIVAISPRPPVSAGECSAPPREAWRTLYAGRSIRNEQAPKE